MKHFRLLKCVLLAMLFSIVPVYASALSDDECCVDGIYYRFNMDMTAEVIVNPNKYTGDVVIPSTFIYQGATYTVTGIHEEAFMNCTNLTSIVFPNTLVEIGEWAFRYCFKLQQITLPNSLETIEDGAFLNCDQLATIKVGTGIKVIKATAFSYCNTLKDFYCYATTPPTLRDDVFILTPCSTATLHVPNGTVETYRNANSQWAAFGSIVAISGEEGGGGSEGGGGGDTPTGNVLFYESFKNCNGTGGNDGQFNSGANSTFTPDNEGWEYTDAYGGKECARFGKSTRSGQCKTPAITISEKALLTFKAAPWGSDGTTLTISAEGADVAIINNERSMNPGEWTEDSVMISGSGTIQLVFTPAKRFFLDEVKVESGWGKETGGGGGGDDNPPAADEIYIDGIYYHVDTNAMTAEVVSGTNKYKGDVVIPSSINYQSVTYTVVHVHEEAFLNASELTSITFPNTLVELGESAFAGCSLLKEVTFPNSMETIEDGAFYGCTSLTTVNVGTGINVIKKYAFANCTQLKDFYCYATTPPTLRTDVFTSTPCSTATLHVPSGTVETYRNANSQWAAFGSIVAIGGDNPPQPKKCEKPAVSYEQGKLRFSSATPNVTFHSNISNPDIRSYETEEVTLGVTYTVSVYATAPDYETSETTIVTLCWLNATPSTHISQSLELQATPVMIQSNGGVLTITGVEEGTTVGVYGIGGQLRNTATASGKTLTIDSRLSRGSVALIKIGDTTVKLVVK